MPKQIIAQTVPVVNVPDSNYRNIVPCANEKESDVMSSQTELILPGAEPTLQAEIARAAAIFRYSNTAVAPMTAEEANKCLRRVKVHLRNAKEHLEQARRGLLELQERRGWEALGYPSFEEFAVKRFGYDRSYIFRLLNAAKVEKRIANESPIGDKGHLRENALRELAKVTEDKQVSVFEEAYAQADGKPISGKLVRAVGVEMGLLTPTQPTPAPNRNRLSAFPSPAREPATNLPVNLRKAERVCWDAFNSRLLCHTVIDGQNYAIYATEEQIDHSGMYAEDTTTDEDEAKTDSNGTVYSTSHFEPASESPIGDMEEAESLRPGIYQNPRGTYETIRDGKPDTFGCVRAFDEQGRSRLVMVSTIRENWTFSGEVAG